MLQNKPVSFGYQLTCRTEPLTTGAAHSYFKGGRLCRSSNRRVPHERRGLLWKQIQQVPSEHSTEATHKLFSRQWKRLNKSKWAPWASQQNYLDHLVTVMLCRLLLLGIQHFEAPLLTLFSQNMYNLMRETKKRKMTPWAEERHASEKLSTSVDEHETRDWEIRDSCWFLRFLTHTVGEKSSF